jgi:hypothetical protein
MKIFPLTIYVLLKPFIQILPSDSKKNLWDSRTTATLAINSDFVRYLNAIWRHFPANFRENLRRGDDKTF